MPYKCHTIATLHSSPPASFFFLPPSSIFLCLVIVRPRRRTFFMLVWLPTLLGDFTPQTLNFGPNPSTFVPCSRSSLLYSPLYLFILPSAATTVPRLGSSIVYFPYPFGDFCSQLLYYFWFSEAETRETTQEDMSSTVGANPHEQCELCRSMT